MCCCISHSHPADSSVSMKENTTTRSACIPGAPVRGTLTGKGWKPSAQLAAGGGTPRLVGPENYVCSPRFETPNIYCNSLVSIAAAAPPAQPAAQRPRCFVLLCGCWTASLDQPASERERDFGSFCCVAEESVLQQHAVAKSACESNWRHLQHTRSRRQEYRDGAGVCCCFCSGGTAAAILRWYTLEL